MLYYTLYCLLHYTDWEVVLLAVIAGVQVWNLIDRKQFFYKLRLWGRRGQRRIRGL